MRESYLAEMYQGMASQANAKKVHAKWKDKLTVLMPVTRE